MAKKKCKNGVCKIGNTVVSVQAPPPVPNATQRSVISQQLSPLGQQSILQPSLQQSLQQLQQPSFQGDQGDIQRRLVQTQLSPLNNQSPQQPSYNLNALPAQGQPQQSTLQQNLNALPGQGQNAQGQPVSDTAAQALLQKVENKIPLQPQEAMALRDYIQQYAPQQQGQYNAQGYLQGPLTGLFATDDQQANVPYEQSAIWKLSQAINNNPNAPAALKNKSPEYWKALFPVLWGDLLRPSLVQKSLNQGNVNLPGFPSNVLHTPQAAAQVQSQQGGLQPGQPGYGDPYGVTQDNGRGGPTVLGPNGQQRGDVAGAFLGYHPEVYEKSLLSGYQQRASNYLLDQGLRGIQQNRPNFLPIANQQLEKFYTQTVPTLAERFTAMGNGQRSSAFQGALANAGRGLHNDLAAQNQQLNQQNYANSANLLNFGFAPRFENIVNPGTGGLLNALPQIATAATKAYVGV